MSCCVNINWNCLSPSKKNVDYIKEFVDNINSTIQEWDKTLSDYNIKVDNLYEILDKQGNIDVTKLQTQIKELEEYVKGFIESQYIYTGKWIANNFYLGSRELVAPINVPMTGGRYSLVVSDITDSGKVYKTINYFTGSKNTYLSGTGEFVTMPTIPDINPLKIDISSNTSKITALQTLWNTYWQEVKNSGGSIYGIKPVKQFYLKDAPKLSSIDFVVSDTYYMPIIQKRSVGSDEYTIQGVSAPLQYTTENTKKYFSKAGTWETIPDNGSSSDIQNLIIETTYRDLKNLRALNNLIPGAYYTITDYQTIVFSDTASSLGKPCPLMVQAITNSILSEDAIMIVDYNVYNCKYCLDNDKTRFAFVNPYDTIVKTDADIFYIRDTEQSTPIWRRLDEVTSIQDIIDQYGNNLNPSDTYIQTNKDYGQEEYLEGIGFFENYMYHTPAEFTYANASDNAIVVSDTTNSARIVEVYPTSKGVIYEMTDSKGNTLPYDFIHIIFWNKIDEDTNIEGYTFSVCEYLEGYKYEEVSYPGNICNNTLMPIYEWNTYVNGYIQILNNVIYYFKDQSGDCKYYCINNNFSSIYNTIFENCCIKNITFKGDGYKNYFKDAILLNVTFGNFFHDNGIYKQIMHTTFGDAVFSNIFSGEITSSYIGNNVENCDFADLYACNIEGNNASISAYYVIDKRNRKMMVVNLKYCIIKLNTGFITLGITTSDDTYTGTAYKYILDSSITNTDNKIMLMSGELDANIRIIKNTTNTKEIEVSTLTQ